MIKLSIFFSAALILTTLPVRADNLTGPATVIDGKTIEVAGTRLQLFAIDAPALSQSCTWPNKTIPCGKLAKWALMDLVIGATVNCTWRKKNKLRAICQAGGFDLARNLVHTGWALSDRYQSLRYVVNENEAKAAKRGLWKGKFVSPKHWRKQNKQTSIP